MKVALNGSMTLELVSLEHIVINTGQKFLQRGTRAFGVGKLPNWLDRFKMRLKNNLAVGELNRIWQ